MDRYRTHCDFRIVPLIFRSALAGIAGAGTIPSAFRLIVSKFEPEELNVAFTIFGLSAAVTNGTGLIIAGLFGFITAGGQLSAWRWVFRMFAIICIPFSLLTLGSVPKIKGESATGTSTREKHKRLDMVGTLTMLFAIIHIILGLTLGASYGFRIHQYALIPSSFWRIRNIKVVMALALGGFTWWNMYQSVLVERFLKVFIESPIIAAIRIFPSGIAVVAVAMMMPRLLSFFKVQSYRWIISFGSIIAASTYLLMIYSKGEIYDNAYWRWILPDLLVGSASAMAVYLGTNITVMTSVPPSMSGVACGTLQVFLQIGNATVLSVQAGFLILNEGSVTNFSNVQASY
ncbi:hypothetical protein V866_004679 [Kwoniella sp. B9012]